MIGFDGKVYGHCIGFFLVTRMQRKFRCLTPFTASQINVAQRQGLAINELAAQLNVTGWNPVTTSNEEE
jgi:hypothetical protein